MVSKSSDSVSKSRGSDGLGMLTYKLNQLKKQIQAARIVSVKEKLEKNEMKLESDVFWLRSAATSRHDVPYVENVSLGKLLCSRIENPLCKISSLAQGSGDKDYASCEEVVCSTSAKLPPVEKIPPYTTWIFLDRNQRMAEDQSVVGRRRIYYDQHGSEALICSDSEEEIAEPEQEKHEFSEGEDRVIWMAFQEHDLGDELVDIVMQFVGGNFSEIRERYDMLKGKNKEKHGDKLKGSGEIGSEKSIFLDKSLSAALDSFDNLFCRRCLVFDCRLHGCSQSLVNPREKQSYSSESDEDGKPCGDQCYLQLKDVKNLPECSVTNPLHRIISENSVDESGPPISLNAEEQVPHYENTGKRKFSKDKNTVQEAPMLGSDDLEGFSSKKQKKLSAPNVVTVTTEGSPSLDQSSCAKSKDLEFEAPRENEPCISTEVATGGSSSEPHLEEGSCHTSDLGNKIEYSMRGETKVTAEVPTLEQSFNLMVGQDKMALGSCEWKPLEKELYMKGVEIFGRNSCLIARNLLSGLKTCTEVSSYMCANGAAMPHGSIIIPTSCSDDNAKADTEHLERELPTRSRLLRRRGRARKLKYSWKSAGHPSMWRRIADGKNQSCQQYMPCGCQSMCGKQCPCLSNGTCCEKYCGCSKSCKNRFRGCHCAKSQCRSRQCPCFAAGRECDPDVCRNCWVSCGDGSLGEPPKQGDGQCGNMRLLLRQQQRVIYHMRFNIKLTMVVILKLFMPLYASFQILLAKSDVAGWGAFLKNPVNKNDYLGEYTGELISHREADKRGKIYDRANSSFLFDLNDQASDIYHCGDGSLGEPPKQGDGQCGNMRLLLRQQQRILLAKSDVAGWGAFLKNPVNKNDYLGEYTGELISHREADKRGKIYDRANSSFLFDLNDQYVLDAYRKGDKLKFANHSSNPNCYAKVMLVAGDHRVGIFAKEHIEASEELFYDYRYGPDQAPVWARRPENSKGDDSSINQGRAKKHQSN
ncbi:unnamed protein product [Ilex paraguariensis]|uniref:[Histone H3]-lysine(27) N-trimethyltransferase n=1 Tax=Ilex paraguariensis TaxID=185542 RepID=A0ABC8RJT7_9AQUA